MYNLRRARANSKFYFQDKRRRKRFVVMVKMFASKKFRVIQYAGGVKVATFIKSLDDCLAYFKNNLAVATLGNSVYSFPSTIMTKFIFKHFIKSIVKSPLFYFSDIKGAKGSLRYSGGEKFTGLPVFEEPIFNDAVSALTGCNIVNKLTMVKKVVV